MDSRRASYFLTVADEGSFSAAARALHLSQPALSAAVRELEASLGSPLLERLPRGVQLTEAGAAFARHARLALAELAAGASAVREVLGLEGGSLSVCCLPTLATDPMAATIGELRRRHPALRIDLSCPTDPDELLGAVRTGNVELGLSSLVALPSDLECVPAGVQELCCLLPPGDPERGPLDLHRLAERELIAVPAGAATRQALDDAFASAGLTPRIAVETSARDAVVPLVLAGAGVAVVPRHLASLAAAQGAVIVDLAPSLDRTLYLVGRAGPRSPAARAFSEILLGVART
jgi:DNA-binding transcriptional LysR family regulator